MVPGRTMVRAPIDPSAASKPPGCPRPTSAVRHVSSIAVRSSASIAAWSFATRRASRRSSRSPRPVGTAVEEVPRVRPAGVHPPERAQPVHRRPRSRPVGGIGRERRGDAVEEDAVEVRAPCGAADRQEAADHGRIPYGPLVALQRAHRPSRSECDAPHSQRIQQGALCTHVVGDRDQWKRAGERMIRRRRRQSVAEHVDRDHEPVPWIEHAARSDPRFVTAVRAGVVAGQQDTVGAVPVECPVGAVGEVRAGEVHAELGREPPQREASCHRHVRRT